MTRLNLLRRWLPSRRPESLEDYAKLALVIIGIGQAYQWAGALLRDLYNLVLWPMQLLRALLALLLG